jgi:hypothetical protein
MREPSRTAKVSVTASLLISALALRWLLSEPARSMRFGLMDKLGYASGVFCAIGAMGLSWAAIVAYIGRKNDWSPRKCGLVASLSFILLGAVLLVAIPSVSSRASSLVICSASIIGFACRKLAYPELTQEELYAPEPPLTLFSK